MDLPSGFMSHIVEPQGKTLDARDAWIPTERERADRGRER